MPKNGEYQFNGFHGPRYTMVPNDIFDELLAELTGNELKVLLYIARRTFGFQKDADAISLDQFVNGISKKDGTLLDRGAGVSRQGAIEATKSLAAKGVIRVIAQEDENGGSAASLYQLRFIDGGQESVPPESRNLTPGGTKKNREGVQKFDPQKKDVQNKVKQNNVNADGSNVDAGFFGVAAENQALVTDQEDEHVPAYSAWIGAVVTDYSREFNDLANTNSNVERALRLWKRSGKGEADFVQLLQAAKLEMRRVQSRGPINKTQKFFASAEALVGAEPNASSSASS